MLRILAVLTLLATPLAAADLPALFDVTDVASDDVLNIRENPRASATRIGELAHDATDVEITALSDSGDWGRLNMGERAGWVSMRYLAAQPLDRQTYFQGGLTCYGTEPFWDITFDIEGNAILTTPFADPGPAPMTVLQAETAQNTGLYAQFARLSGPGTNLAVVRRAECSDGMSDRMFGLSIDLIHTQGGQTTLVTGCCSLN